MNSKEFLAWEEGTNDTLDVKKMYIDIAGDLASGVMLSQIVYWNLPNKQGKSKLRVSFNGKLWLAKGREDWWDECRITPKQADRCLDNLESKGIIETILKKFEKAPTKHIWLNVDKLAELITQLLNNTNDELDFPQRLKSDSISTKGENRFSPKVKINIPERLNSITETTPEITTEIKEEEEDAFTEVVKLFKVSLTKITLNDVTTKLLRQFCDQYGYDYMKHIIEVLAKGDVRTFNGFETYLEGYIKQGLNTIAKLDRFLKAKKTESRELSQKEQERRRKRAEAKPIYGKPKTDNFCNFEQREYDYKDLEHKLLGEVTETAEEQPEVESKPKRDSNINLQQFYSDLKKNGNMTDTSINIWIKPLGIDLKGDSVSIIAPNATAKKFVEQHYIQPIANALKISHENIKIVEG